MRVDVVACDVFKVDDGSMLEYIEVMNIDALAIACT